MSMQVIQIVLSKSILRHSTATMVSLYMPGLTPHLPMCIQNNLSAIIKEVIELGGKSNASYRFLKPGCTDTFCTSANTRVCRGVLRIARTNDLPVHVLQELDSG